MSEAGAQTHLNLSGAVALRFGNTPVGSALQAQAGLREVEVVHEVVEHPSELQVYLFPDNDPLLHAQIQVEVSQPADTAATATVGVEA